MVFLSICIDLLRRLSKSQNTVFCGRIQLFLARLFPLSEKSGRITNNRFFFFLQIKWDQLHCLKKLSSLTNYIHVLPFCFHPGLNLQSQFNLDNVTVFNKNEQETTFGHKVRCYSCGKEIPKRSGVVFFIFITKL